MRDYMFSTNPSNLDPSDPRRLRDLLGKLTRLAEEKQLRSVVVGMVGSDSDALMPEMVDFIESALRVEDSIFRITRDRAALFLADVDRVSAQQIVERLLADFAARFPTRRSPEVSLGYFEVGPATSVATLKDVLPAVFSRN